MKQTSLSVVTFNICLAPFFRRPYRRIAEFAKHIPEDIDIVNLQEVYTYDMLWRLQNSLKGYSFCFKHGLYGPRSGLVTISRQPITLERFIRLSKQKGILMSRLASGILVVNVHLVANTDGDWSRKNRYFKEHQKQLERLSEKLANKNNVILSGDFNLAKTSELYEYFKSSGRWTDSHDQDFSPTFHKEFLPVDREPQRIDYIFIKGSFVPHSGSKIFEDKINGMYLSNHIGLQVGLIVN